ncbi:MAG: hypothetical protein E6Q33_09070 [Neisseriales bacterium]|jgi:hydrogenase maturation factor HypF (carbamoyltransferase family)|nr:MAG: hypothetical protein E6Q33_09070 [Neisseriales bacterium]
MRTFKDQLDIDINQIFLNLKEFADYHLLNNKQILCILDTNLVNTRKYNRVSSFDDSLYECDVVILYKYEAYPKVFVTNSECYLDNRKYHVQHFSCDDGVVELRLMGA